MDNMKLPKAIDFFKNIQSNIRMMGHNSSDEAMAQNMLSEVILKETIEALEKQIPKKPKFNRQIGNLMLYKCHICENEIRGNDKFCANCGQAIDWGEVDG